MGNLLSPLNEAQLTALGSLSSNLDRDQLLWLSGYFQGLLAKSAQPVQSELVQVASKKQLKILYGTHTGKSKLIAGQLSDLLSVWGIEVQTVALDEYKPKQITSETNLVCIVSTHGEGEPPAMAEDFHSFITGKRSPKLPDLNYAVVALGDKSYRLFCKTGLDIDQAFSRAGAHAILPVLTLDVDYEDEVTRWINQFSDIFAKNEISSVQPVTTVIHPQKKALYSRNNPFWATVLEKVRITGRGSDKEVYHIELSLEDSGITYDPGDSVGILANNPPELVGAILDELKLTGNETVTIKENELPLREALINQLEITVLNREVIQNYQRISGDKLLLPIIENEELLEEYLYGHDVLDLLQEFPFQVKAQDLADLLRIFPARLYSISSSQSAVGDEVHITVSTVRYFRNGRKRTGACSSYLADRIEVDSTVSVFIEKNPSFKLPADKETPLILIGAGTGIAPYRSFLQHRESNEQKGKAWLFFGERRFHSDFLYQLEWQKFLKEGFLEKLDVAFSRDQDQKVYVQNRLAERSKEVFEWLNKGANIYLCGDMKKMARDVQTTLLQIIETEGGMSSEKALDFLKKLKKEKRFQVDIY